MPSKRYLIIVCQSFNNDKQHGDTGEVKPFIAVCANATTVKQASLRCQRSGVRVKFQLFGADDRGCDMTGKAKPKARKAKKSSRPSKPLNDWRVETLSRMRELLLKADPALVEERKWKKPSNPAGVPTWSRDGIVCTGETYKNVVKLTFARGASLPDPKRLFNSSLEGNLRRAIDIPEGETVDATAFKALVRAAVALNRKSKAQ